MNLSQTRHENGYRGGKVTAGRSADEFKFTIKNGRMVNQAENRGSINEDEDAVLELSRLRESAKLAAIYHSGEGKFEKRTDLSHIVHVALHCVQFTFILAIEIFHHVHHYVNKRRREKDADIPALPEERNPIFFLYPICMLVSLTLAILWLVKKILPERPAIPLAACATAAVLILLTGIMEMKHADMYIDLDEITDEELLEHPVFIHNFVMCILSIFVMIMYLIQAWILFDYWQWIRTQRDSSPSTTEETQSSDSSPDTDVTESTVVGKKIDEPEFRQQVGELAPIPTFEDLSAITIVTESDDDDEPILYCCFVDWYNYVKMKMESKPRHEFQVVHVM